MSKVIQIVIADKRPNVVGAPGIVCGNSDYSIEFTFDAEWADLTAKVARFVYVQEGTVKYQDVPFTGTTVAVPVLYTVKEVLVGVYAGELRTTTPARIPCDYSILCGNAVENGDPQARPDLQTQIGNLADLTTDRKSSIVAAINWLYGIIPLDKIAELENTPLVVTVQSSGGPGSSVPLSHTYNEIYAARTAGRLVLFFYRSEVYYHTGYDPAGLYFDRLYTAGTDTTPTYLVVHRNDTWERGTKSNTRAFYNNYTPAAGQYLYIDPECTTKATKAALEIAEAQGGAYLLAGEGGTVKLSPVLVSTKNEWGSMTVMEELDGNYGGFTEFWTVEHT